MIFSVVALTACRILTKETNSPKTQCESEAYIWYESKCQRRDQLQPKLDCQAKGPDWQFLNNICVHKEKPLILEEECKKKANSYWSIDPKTKVGVCVTTSTISSEQECIKNKDYLWQNGRCLSPSAQACEKSGDTWYLDRCMSKDEKTCLLKADGSLWINLHCASAIEQGCEANPLKKWVTDATIPCTDKNFYDLCIDPKAPAEQKQTVAALRSLEGINKELSIAGCRSASDALKQRTYMDLSSKNLTNLFIFREFTQLKNLILDTNNLGSFDALSALANLEVLSLNNNHITSTAPVAALTHLVSFYANNNLLTKLEGFNRLTALEGLYVNGNKLEDLTSLIDADNIASGYLGNLITLQASENCDLKNLGSVYLLKELTLLYINEIGLPPSELEALRPLFGSGTEINYNQCDS